MNAWWVLVLGLLLLTIGGVLEAIHVHRHDHDPRDDHP